MLVFVLAPVCLVVGYEHHLHRWCNPHSRQFCHPVSPSRHLSSHITLLIPTYIIKKTVDLVDEVCRQRACAARDTPLLTLSCFSHLHTITLTLLTATQQQQAIDLVDEACSNVRVQLDSKPEDIDSLERQRVRLQVEEQALKKEKDPLSQVGRV